MLRIQRTQPDSLPETVCELGGWRGKLGLMLATVVLLALASRAPHMALILEPGHGAVFPLLWGVFEVILPNPSQ